MHTSLTNRRIRIGYLLSAAGLLIPIGCAHQTPEPLFAADSLPVPLVQQSKKKPAAPKIAYVPRFREVAREAGLNYRWQIPGKRPLNILQTIGNGCAFLDYDQDGNLDILLVGPKLGLYKGDGKGRFMDAGKETGLDKLTGHFLGCAVGDYDNDGWPDLYVSGWRTGLLLHNETTTDDRRPTTDHRPPTTDDRPPTTDHRRPTTDDRPPNTEHRTPNTEHRESTHDSRLTTHDSGSGRRFRDVTQEAGLRPQPWGTSGSFADLDGDGYLDLYVCNYVDFDPDTDLQHCPFHGILTGCGPNNYDALKGTLYHNEGGSRFHDVTRVWGVVGTGKGLGVAFANYENPSRIGFAVANDLMEGDLFQNLGKGKFKNIGRDSGTAMDESGEVHAGMGIDWGDYDNDGRLDLFVTTFGYETKCLYHNEGRSLFSIVSDKTGLLEPTLPYVGWGCKFFDADNDGWLDLIVANGHVQDNIARFEDATYRQPLQFLHNTRGPRKFFADASRTAGIGRLPALVGRGVAVGDYDNDGRVDSLVVDSEGRPLLLHNESITPENSWIGFRLIGNRQRNRDAYGAVIQVMVGGKKRVRQCHPGGSYLSSSDPRVHFGLGSATPDRVTVRWPDGGVRSWTNLTPGRYWTLQEDEPSDRMTRK